MCSRPCRSNVWAGAGCRGLSLFRVFVALAYVFCVARALRVGLSCVTAFCVVVSLERDGAGLCYVCLPEVHEEYSQQALPRGHQQVLRVLDDEGLAACLRCASSKQHSIRTAVVIGHGSWHRQCADELMESYFLNHASHRHSGNNARIRLLVGRAGWVWVGLFQFAGIAELGSRRAPCPFLI